MTLVPAGFSTARLTAAVHAHIDRAQARSRALRQNASAWTSVTMHSLTKALLAENEAQLRALQAELMLLMQRSTPKPLPPPLPKRLDAEAHRALEPYFTALDDTARARGLQLQTWFVPEETVTVVFPCVRLPDGRTYELGMVLLLRWPLHDGVRKTSEELSAQLCALLRRFEETKDALMAAWPAGSTPREGIRALAR